LPGLFKFYDNAVLGLAALAGASTAFMTIAIIVDVILRNLGFHPFQWTSAVVEYLLLFIAMGAGPWLLRVGGHVAISSFVDKLPPGPGLFVKRMVIVVSAFVLGWLAWRAAAIGAHEFSITSTDIRSINIPGWVAYAMLAAGFALMGIETLRLLAGRERDAS
jgi:TRAP-type C4-dicarboxylate transport system permease small subunit